MERILKDVTGVSYEDEDRLRNMINDMIESGELKATSAFVAEPEKRRARRRKAAEREAMVRFFFVLHTKLAFASLDRRTYFTGKLTRKTEKYERICLGCTNSLLRVHEVD